MADNVLESGPPSAKRPKLSSPALSVSASDGNGKYTACITYLVIKHKLASSVGALNTGQKQGVPAQLHCNFTTYWHSFSISGAF